MFGRKKKSVVPLAPISQPSQRTKQKPVNEGCEMRLKRDKSGRIIGIKTTGKCTKEDKLIFAQDNEIKMNDLERGDE